MKLRFYARPGFVCSMPGPKVKDTLPRYIGREVKVDEGLQSITNPAVAEAVEIESTSKEGQRVLRQMICDGSEYPLWPADEATARACGVPFVEVERVDGEWQPRAKRAAPRTLRGEVA